jgi:hypothetical protein
MSLQTQSIFTAELTNDTFIINGNTNITYCSVELLAGAATVQGSLVVNGIPSGAIPLSVNRPFIISNDGNNLIDGVTISFPAGTVRLTCQ